MMGTVSEGKMQGEMFDQIIIIGVYVCVCAWVCIFTFLEVAAWGNVMYTI